MSDEYNQIVDRQQTVKQKRTAREKDRITAELAGLNYERREIQAEMHMAQRTYANKMEKFIARMQQVTDRQKQLLVQTEKLLRDNNLCSAFSSTLVAGHQDSEHKFHTCQLEYDHAKRHLCACGGTFSDAVSY